MTMPDSQQNLYLIENVEDIVVFQGLKITTFFLLTASPIKPRLYLFRFTQNLSVFRRDINESLKGPNITSSVNDMMTS